MKSDSFNNDFTFNDKRVAAKLILETSFSKEIRILLKKGQAMREHTAPCPIVVHLLEGSIDFGVEGEANRLTKGAILTLEGNVPHDLYAHEDSVVRLTLTKHDDAARVKEVAKTSK